MKEIQFAGEHLLIGNIGKISIFLALAAALFSFITYAFGVNKTDEEAGFWKRMGRLGFSIHALSVASIFITLFIIIQQHYFEYQYAWQHSSMELPLRYMVSCFWEGQEGSFLLWMVWHVVLGLILIWRSGKWELPVMAIMALAQVMLASMLLGIDIFGIKLGSNPFILLREAQPNILQIPVLEMLGKENYLQAVKDGTGLNPLLQNYWMVIHPPTLFLGFASAIVPFAYAMAGLWTKNEQGWVKPSIPWTLFGVMILGTGIIMGAFWAYESLSFGGYWAWDPVENASLIPWLLLIGLAHTQLIHQRTGKALYMSLLMAIFSFLLVLYATFLTRSGVLGNTSVHAFTDLGMSGQLLIFFFLFVAVPSILALRKPMHQYLFVGIALLALIINIVFGHQRWISYPVVSALFVSIFITIFRAVPIRTDIDEELSSREFWMFIGSLVFVLSCIQVVVWTSIPVWSKLFDAENLAPPTDPVYFYNKWQMPFALIIGILVGFGQLLKYKKTNSKKFGRLLISLIIASVALSVPIAYLFQIHRNILLSIFLGASIFALLGNVVYIFQVLKGKISLSGGSIAHIGFGLMLLGVIASGAGKQVISFNQSGIDFGENFNDTEKRENILLWKNVPTLMGDYMVTYKRDTVIEPNTYYIVDYQGFDRKTGQPTDEQFTLMPNAQVNPKMGLVSNPDTRHYLTYDVFTHVTQVPDKESTKKNPFGKFKTHEMKLGDTLFINNLPVIFRVFQPLKNPKQYDLEDAEHALIGEFEIQMLRDTLFAHPIFAIKDNRIATIKDDIHEAGIRIEVKNILTDPENFQNTRFEVETGEKPPFQDYIIMKAMIFPYINLLWGGTIIMVLGFLMSIYQRIKGRKLRKEQEALEAEM